MTSFRFVAVVVIKNMQRFLIKLMWSFIKTATCYIGYRLYRISRKIRMI